MTDTFRALCEEMADWIDDETRIGQSETYLLDLDEHPLVVRARAALAEQPVGQSRRCFYNPVQIAECGGPCEQIGPEACDCGALWVGRDAEQPVAPTDEGLLKTYCDARRAFYFEDAEGESDQGDRKAAAIAGLRAVLARWGTSNLAQVRSSLGEVVEDDVDLYLEQ
jgi:hypothetical protein